MARDLVRNAGSERQVRRAEQEQRETEEYFVQSLKAVLDTAPGRRVIAGLLAEFRVNGTVWHDHGSRMAYNVGQQDAGHYILAKALEANEPGVELMQRETRLWRERKDRKAEQAAAADAVAEGAVDAT